MIPVNEPLLGSSIGRRQRELGLRHQIRSIQKDLAGPEDPHCSEIKEFEDKIRNSGMPEDAVEIARASIPAGVCEL